MKQLRTDSAFILSGLPYPHFLRWISLLIMILGTTLSDRSASASLFINEVMPSNNSTIHDPAGDFEDWIEIYNAGESPLDLAGMYLTDTPSQPQKWRIPEGFSSQTTISPGGFLLIWADEEPQEGPLHTNFKLSKEGEEVVLFDRNGITLLDRLAFGEIPTDISYGRHPDGRNEFNYFSQPTPGTSNQSGLTGMVADTRFTVDRGFYTTPFQLSILCDTPGAEIRYTLDGSVPTLLSPLFSAPLSISRTTVLRAKAFKPGYLPSNTDTQTYFFVSDIKQQSPTGAAPGPGWPAPNTNSNVGPFIDYGMDPNVVNDPRYSGLIEPALLALPAFSMVTDLKNLFDPTTGIYSVPWASGPEWERPASIELIYPDGRKGFQIDCGIRLRGSSSANWENPKHGFRLFFRSEYGDPVLRYPLFEDEGTDVFEKIDLRTSQNFSWAREAWHSLGGTMNRDVLWRDTQRDMGQPYTRSRYYHLYINGDYWGIYQTQERSEANFGASYLGGRPEDYDTIKSNAVTVHVVGATDGNEEAWRRLWQACQEGFHSDAAYYRVQGLDLSAQRVPEYEPLVDLDNLIDYMLIVFCSGSVDGPLGKWSNDTLVNNYFALYNRVNPAGWKHFVHDFETTMMALNEDRIGPFTAGSQYASFSAQWLHQKLSDHPEYRLQFADRVHKHFFNEGALTSGALIQRFMARANQIELAIIAESARWGDAKQEPPSTKDETWIPSIRALAQNYFPYRPGVVLNQLRSKGLYPSVAAPLIQVNGAPRHGGSVSLGDLLAFDNPNSSGTIYYTLDGSDVHTPLRISAHEEIAIIPENATRQVLIPGGPIDPSWRSSLIYNVSGWREGRGGVGFDSTPDYLPFIGIDVQNQMYRINGSCLVRIPFRMNPDQLSGLNSLTLSLRYDDGFVAYLNGTEVQRDFFTGTPQWNSVASGGRPDDPAFVTFDLSAHLSTLQAGDNLLAIHALNAGANSSDFLISALLTATRNGPGSGALTPSAQLYHDPFPLNRSVTLKARCLLGGTWSAMSEATLTLDNQSLLQIH